MKRKLYIHFETNDNGDGTSTIHITLQDQRGEYIPFEANVGFSYDGGNEAKVFQGAGVGVPCVNGRWRTIYSKNVLRRLLSDCHGQISLTLRADVGPVEVYVGWNGFVFVERFEITDGGR